MAFIDIIQNLLINYYSQPFPVTIWKWSALYLIQELLYQILAQITNSVVFNYLRWWNQWWKIHWNVILDQVLISHLIWLYLCQSTQHFYVLWGAVFLAWVGYDVLGVPWTEVHQAAVQVPSDAMIIVLQIKNDEKLNEYRLILRNLGYLYQSMVIARMVMEVGDGPENIGT